MRRFPDSTEAELAWARTLIETYPFYCEFPATPEKLLEVQHSWDYQKDDQVHIVGYKAMVAFHDRRHGQAKTVRLIMGVSLPISHYVLANSKLKMEHKL